MAILKPIVGVIKNYTIGIFIVLFMLTQFCLYAQKNKISCDYLQKIIESREFMQYNVSYIEDSIYVFINDTSVIVSTKDYFKDSVINLIDLTGYFDDCGTYKWHQYSIKVTSLNPKKYVFGEYDKTANKMDITIGKIKKIKEGLLITFWDPGNNSYRKILVGKSNSKYIIKEIQSGSF